MPDRPNIKWTLPKLKKLWKAYKDAVDSGLTSDDTIQFEGHTLNLGYARHLGEYLNPILSPIFRGE
jgi:hypothetical protein